MKGLLEKVKTEIDEAIFPSNIYCIRCGSLIDRSRPYALCDSCMKDFHWINGRTCEKCGKALQDTYKGKFCYDCMRYEHKFDKGFTCLVYGLREREVLLEHKYNSKGYLAAKFGDILYDRMACENMELDVIIPVPISAGRMKKRGYNQSALMARQLSKRSGIPIYEKALLRNKETGLLRSLNPADRRLLLTGAFEVPKKAERLIEGKKILLIDDVYTTGATADTCAEALKKAGADRVYVLTLASGGNRRPDEER